MPDNNKDCLLTGNLDIFVARYEETVDGGMERWDEILIHGDPEGLRSLAALLIRIADLDQEKVDVRDLPPGAREHYQLQPGIHLAQSSDPVIIGRLDARGTGAYYERFIPKQGTT